LQERQIVILLQKKSKSLLLFFVVFSFSLFLLLACFLESLVPGANPMKEFSLEFYDGVYIVTIFKLDKICTTQSRNLRQIYSFFMLLGSTRAKAVRRTLMKLTPHE